MRALSSSHSLPKALVVTAALLAGLRPLPLAAQTQPPQTPTQAPPPDNAVAPPPPGAPPPATSQAAPLPPGAAPVGPPPLGAPPPAPQPYPPGPYPQPYGQPPYSGAPPPYGASPYPPPPGYAPPPVGEPQPPEPPWPTSPEPAYRKHRLSLQTESVFSADEGPFYNHLLGARYDYQTTRAASLGAYVGYANLKGTGERVHSALAMAQLQYRLFFGSSGRFMIPLRAGVGYLFMNGLVVRFATGPYFAVSDDLEIGLDLIAPTFWSASNDTVISMNLAAEVTLVF